MTTAAMTTHVDHGAEDATNANETKWQEVKSRQKKAKTPPRAPSNRFAPLLTMTKPFDLLTVVLKFRNSRVPWA